MTKVRNVRDMSHRIWEHFLNMEVENADDVKTGAPLMPVLNAELKGFMAGIVDHCAKLALASSCPMDASDNLKSYAQLIRDTPARKVEIPQPDEEGIESISPERVAFLSHESKAEDCGCDPEAEPT